MVKEIPPPIIPVNHIPGSEPPAFCFFPGCFRLAKVIYFCITPHHSAYEFTGLPMGKAIVLFINHLELHHSGNGFTKGTDGTFAGCLIGKTAFNSPVPFKDFCIKTVFKIFPNGFWCSCADNGFNGVVPVVILFRNIEYTAHHAAQEGKTGAVIFSTDVPYPCSCKSWAEYGFNSCGKAWEKGNSLGISMGKGKSCVKNVLFFIFPD